MGEDAVMVMFLRCALRCVITLVNATAMTASLLRTVTALVMVEALTAVQPTRLQALVNPALSSDLQSDEKSRTVLFCVGE